MVHGSYENRSNSPRRGAVINVFRDGVRSASNDPLLEGVPPIRAGEKVGAQKQVGAANQEDDATKAIMKVMSEKKFVFR